MIPLFFFSVISYRIWHYESIYIDKLILDGPFLVEKAYANSSFSNDFYRADGIWTYLNGQLLQGNCPLTTRIYFFALLHPLAEPRPSNTFKTVLNSTNKLLPHPNHSFKHCRRFCESVKAQRFCTMQVPKTLSIILIFRAAFPRPVSLAKYHSSTKKTKKREALIPNLSLPTSRGLN